MTTSPSSRNTAPSEARSPKAMLPWMLLVMPYSHLHDLFIYHYDGRRRLKKSESCSASHEPFNKPHLDFICSYDDRTKSYRIAVSITVERSDETSEAPLRHRQQLRFSTKPQDAVTGLYYYGFRWLDSKSGRWLSRDPVGERGGLNLYGFVENDGVNQWDYLGLRPPQKIIPFPSDSFFKTECECVSLSVKYGTTGHSAATDGQFAVDRNGDEIIERLPDSNEKGTIPNIIVPNAITPSIVFFLNRKNNKECKGGCKIYKLVVKQEKISGGVIETNPRFITTGDLKKDRKGNFSHINPLYNRGHAFADEKIKYTVTVSVADPRYTLDFAIPEGYYANQLKCFEKVFTITIGTR